jgi:polyisoprenyl-phosphate glycosyltransferase
MPPPISTPKISIVVPVYKSRDCLATLVAEIDRVMKQTQDRRRYELILVNDCSPDGSWAEIVRLAAIYPAVRGISLSRNFGQHNATMAGLCESVGHYVVIMDDDLQHPPSAIPALVERLRSGADVCYTTYVERKHALWKRVGSWINDVAATVLLGKPKGLYLSSFKGLNRIVVDAITRYDGPFTYIDGLVLDVTRNISVLPIEHQARFAGDGNYNLYRSISLWLKMATSFSILPLRIASLTGIFLGLLSASFAIFIAVRVLLLGSPHPGWASVFVAVLMVGCMQLLGIGLVGEYLGRAYLRMNDKPQYVVRTRTEISESASRENDDTRVGDDQSEIR